MYKLLSMKHRTFKTPDISHALRSQIQVHLLKQIDVQAVSQAEKLILQPKWAFILRKNSSERNGSLYAPTKVVFTLRC